MTHFQAFTLILIYVLSFCDTSSWWSYWTNTTSLIRILVLKLMN